jgi:cytochrome c1
MPATALAPKLAKSLIKKLSNAKKQMSKENSCTAAHMLGAFQNEVEAQRGKQIADDAALFLTDSTDHLIAQLVQSLPAGKTCRLD